MTVHPAGGMPALDRLNGLPTEAAQRELRSCCAATRWAAELAAGRPYPTGQALAARADAAFAALDWADVQEALNAHPRIGDRIRGTGRESAWSRGEQSGAADADADALRAGNLAYEQRFGWVFLICATGLSGTQMLAALRDRLRNDEVTERRVVRAELAKITHLRLAKLLDQKE